MIEEVVASTEVVIKESNMSMNPSVGQLVNHSSSASASAAAAAAAAASASALSSGPLRCPRCNSSNTKFCYYNNYNLAQPRHFCRTCRRYWTHGGALRNIPIGGSSRRPKPISTKPKPANNNFILPGGPSTLGPTTMWASPYGSTSAHRLMAVLRPNFGPNTNPGPSIGPINSLLCEVPNNYYNNQLNAVISNVGCFAPASAVTSTTSSSSSLAAAAAAAATRSASSVAESITLVGGEFGYNLNSAFVWPHLPTTNDSSTFP